MAQPRISIIIAAHNAAPWLERAICSVLDQDHGSCELIVVDAGSNDHTPALLRLYERRIDTWRRMPPVCAPRAVNLGLSCARGRVIGILPAFGLYLPGTLLRVQELFGREPRMRWLAGTCLVLGGGDRVIGRCKPRETVDLGSVLSRPALGLPGAATFFRRELLDWYGLFDTTLPRAWRLEHACRLVSHGEHATLHDGELAAARPIRRHGEAAIERHLQRIATARRYAPWIGDGAQRCELTERLGHQRRAAILALARHRGDVRGRRLLMHHLIQHPHWLSDPAIRTFLRGGTGADQTPQDLRAAS